MVSGNNGKRFNNRTLSEASGFLHSSINGSEETEMAELPATRTRYDETFWRAHHESWKRSDLNQREYCSVQGISLKAFGNWRANFKDEPLKPGRNLL